ncbi:hypothetical protein [Bdellovibrio sp. HCB274]|uniref:hypothetical protein n=1 Tax=Bdellovibrio sp. HCB274 TaxID=3394361 RepID=UPI0039B3D7B2
MIRSLIAIYLTLFLAPAAFASSVVKVLDGSVAYCNSTASNNKGKFVAISLITESSSPADQDVTLRVAMVQCKNGRWVGDSQPSLDKYTAPNGVKVETSYSNYELLIVDKNYRILLQAPLQDLNAGSYQDQSVTLNKADLPQAYELIVRSQRSVKAANGVRYSERINFGTFRLHAN